MTSLHAIDFWHLFETKENAENMGRQARQRTFNVVSIEPNDESGGYDVQIQVALIPTLSAINKTERNEHSRLSRNNATAMRMAGA